MPFKIQDFGFLLILVMLLYFKNIRLISLIGLICLVMAMPLFAFWVFFTAQRLVMYAAAFLLISFLWQILKQVQNDGSRRNK